MQQGVNNPSKSGAATQFNLGGSTPYSDGLWNNHLIGPLSSQGTFDGDGSKVPRCTTSPTMSTSTETISVRPRRWSLTSISSSGEWASIRATNAVSRAGISGTFSITRMLSGYPREFPGNPNSNAWNHVTLKVQRTSDNHLTYQSITLNGHKSNLNWTFDHGSAQSDWYGVTVNYQMDGNLYQDSYSVYLNNLTLTYQ